MAGIQDPRPDLPERQGRGRGHDTTGPEGGFSGIPAGSVSRVASRESERECAA